MMRSFKSPFPKQPLSEQAWRAHYSKAQRLIIEIGAGVGYQAIHYSQSHPDCFYIAIEKTREKFKKFSARLAHHEKIENLHAVHANACDWISQNILSNEVDEFRILYPNPYPKEKQKNKRWMNMPFMGVMIQCLKNKGTITLATNINAYYLEAKKAMTADWELAIVSDDLVLNNAEPRTHFEKKYLERAEPCYNLVFKQAI